MPRKGKYFLLVFTFLFFLGFTQETYFEFAGTAYKNLKPMAGVKVLLYKNSVKVSEMATPKSGKFGFDLDFGYDYKVVFQAPGHVEQYLVIYTGKIKESKLFTIYECEVHMLESNAPNINVANFKNPFTKVVWGTNPRNNKPGLIDEQPYMDNFVKNITVDLEKIKRDEEEKLVAEKLKKEHEEAERLRKEAEEKARQEQLLAAQKKALEEAELQRKLEEERRRLEEEKKRAEDQKKNNIAAKEEKTNDENVSENLQLTIEKEQKKIKEKQNKGVKIAYENDLIKMVAENERLLREKEFKKQKAAAYTNEVIETLKEEAVLKAKADEVRYNQKQKAKLATLNGQIKNKEMTSLIRNVAENEKTAKENKLKTYPTLGTYKPKNPVGISYELETGKFKSVYTVHVYIDGSDVVYRKEKYSWGMTYYYKNNEDITEQQYKTELSKYKVPL